MNTETKGKSPGATQKARKVAPAVLSARVNELEPLVQKWVDAHPRVAPSHLVRDALRLFLKPYAGKRYAHLVEEGK